jgi:hypothetical protein
MMRRKLAAGGGVEQQTARPSVAIDVELSSMLLLSAYEVNSPISHVLNALTKPRHSNYRILG